VGGLAGLINGLVIAYGRVVPFMATLAMLVAARGLAELLSNKQTQIVTVTGFLEFFRGDFLGIPWLIWIFVLAAVGGWFLLGRTTFGRRTVAIGGNFEATRLAGIRVKRHLVSLYVLVGLSAGIAAVMMLGRTTAGTSTHGQLYELDAIAAVVVGWHAARGRSRHDRRHRASACSSSRRSRTSSRRTTCPPRSRPS
jgi:ribose transport system permease protein